MAIVFIWRLGLHRNSRKKNSVVHPYWFPSHLGENTDISNRISINSIYKNKRKIDQNMQKCTEFMSRIVSVFAYISEILRKVPLFQMAITSHKMPLRGSKWYQSIRMEL